MFSYSINKIPITDIDGKSSIYHIISIYIKYNNTKIKITPDHYNYDIADDKSDHIEISNESYSIICNPSILLLDFHKSGNGFNTYMELTITENDFNDFKYMIDEINEKLNTI